MNPFLVPFYIPGAFLLFLVIICSTIIIVIKILKGGASPKGQKEHSDEAKMIQEIYQGLARMEDRVESLETILLERERRREDRR